MPKNIVVFSDGTGQEGGKRYNTNVYKLFNMVLDRSPEQIVYYDRGLGTGWRKFLGLAFGMGISRNIRDCYRFIFENYVAGDKIYLFGFSRGAATVRSLSSFIHVFGMLPKSRPELIQHAYKIYKTRNERRRGTKAKAFITAVTLWLDQSPKRSAMAGEEIELDLAVLREQTSRGANCLMVRLPTSALSANAVALVTVRWSVRSEFEAQRKPSSLILGACRGL